MKTSLGVEGTVALPRLRGTTPLPDDLYNQRWVARVRARCIVDANGCWLWQGNKAVNGYGQTNYRDKTRIIHRVMFGLVKGPHPVPADRDVCHSCDVKVCCNPNHLWLGTRQDNHADMFAKGRAWQQKDHCAQGHPWSEHAYYHKVPGKRGTWRHCRLCERIKNRVDSGWPRDLAESVPQLKFGYTLKDYLARGAEVVRG